MAIKKNVETGGYYVTYIASVDRSKRRDYQKLPIKRPRNGFIEFIANLFRREPYPFAASPIAAAIDRKIKVEKQVRIASKNGDPSVGGPLAIQIDALLGFYLRESEKMADVELDRLDRYADEEENCLRECRPSEIEGQLESELEKIVNDINGELGTPATLLGRQQAALANFVEDNRLKRTIHWGKPVTRQSIYLLLGITAFEFVLNTAFFSGSQRSGVVGGAALAGLLSITTMILGVAFGLAFQFSNSRAEGRGWYGRAAIIPLAGGTLFYLLLLTLARIAGEAGDLKMFATAAREIQIHPFAGLLDLPALAYFFFSIAVIAGVFFKYIDTMGHFPRLRHRRLAADHAEEEVAAIRTGMTKVTKENVDEAQRALDAAPSLVEAAIVPIKSLLMNYENVTDQFRANVKDIQDAARTLASVVCRHLQLPEMTFTIDYAAALAAVESRLGEFRDRAKRLQEWEEVSQAAMDKCRRSMNALGATKLSEIEARCNAAITARGATLDTPAWPSEVADASAVGQLVGEPA